MRCWKSGIETVLDLVDFDSRLQGVSLVVTGEGRTDWQSAFGKVLHGVGMHSKKYDIPAVAIVGSMGQGAERIYDSGIDSILTTVNAPMELHGGTGTGRRIISQCGETSVSNAESRK